MQEIAACSHEKTAALFKAAVLRDPAGARTQDPNIKSVVLYHLNQIAIIHAFLFR